jgi:signal transduction histidine kinase
MSLSTLFEFSNLLQVIALALSIFNLVAFLWLTFTVWLNGDRRSLIARVGVVGLGLSALFFFIHALLIAAPFVRTPALVATDYLWHLIWLPALGVPYIWFVIGLHYAALINEGWRRRRPLLLVGSAVLGCGVLLLLFFNRTTFTFEGTIRLLAYSDTLTSTDVNELSSLVLLPVLFLCYVTFCALGPWFTFARVWRLGRALWHNLPYRRGHGALRQSLIGAFWDDPVEVDLLEEPVLSWHLARPGLFLAALSMVALTTSLGVLAVWSMAKWLGLRQPHHPAPPLPPGVIPFNLVVLDIIATGSVAVIVLLIGYSIVRHGILIERPLARRGFFEQWRGIVIVATTIAVFIALFVLFTHSNLSGLLFITSLATCAYALFTWSNYTTHDRYIALLGPFLRSTNLRHWLNTDVQKTEQGMEALFFHLCKDVLEVQCAFLEVLAGPVRRNFNYRWPLTEKLEELEKREKAVTPFNAANAANAANKSASQHEPFLTNRVKVRDVSVYRIKITLHGLPTICWVLPIYDELGLVAKLYLGPRQDGAMFTDEDMDLAHACGQRILDTLRDHEAMLAVSGLLRRRIVDVKLLDAQQRRILHDEILPQMHLALLRLETLRPVIADDDRHATIPRTAALDEAITTISEAHRSLAAMMRATTPGAPHRLERDGMIHAMRTMIEQDFRQAFDEVKWDVTSEMARYIDDNVPPAIAELIFAAVQEALRNAARHGRGSDVHRHLTITLKATCNPHLEVIVADDGIGIISASSTTGTGGGLLTHSALLAIAGGSLTVKSSPGQGVVLRILLPAETLR